MLGGATVLEPTTLVQPARRPLPGRRVDDMGGFAELLQSAVNEGAADSYSAKRRETRYNAHARIEVRLAGESESAPGIIRDISEAGVGFATHGAFGEEDEVELRLWPAEGMGWVRARIEYVATGLRGNIVGARFERRLPSPIVPEHEPEPAGASPASPTGGRRMKWWLLTLAGAAACAAWINWTRFWP